MMVMEPNGEVVGRVRSPVRGLADPETPPSRDRRHDRVALGSLEDVPAQLRSMLDALSGDQFFGSRADRCWIPRINVYELEDRLFVCVELAGMPREAIEVRAEPGTLHVEGTRPKPTPPADLSHVGIDVMEIDSGMFRRKVTLPGDVIIEKVCAHYRDGYLWVELPRERRGAGADTDTA